MEEDHKLSRKLLRAWQFFVMGVVLFVFVLGGLMMFEPKGAIGASPPTIITYQGKLLDGNLAASSTFNMQFSLFDALTAGNALYTASGTLNTATGTVSVTPTNGLFTVDLGGTGTNAMIENIFQNNASIYLEVVVGSETLSPRRQITVAPYSYNAKYLDGVAATSTASSSRYIPVSDSAGAFTFGNVSTTMVTSTRLVASTSLFIGPGIGYNDGRVRLDDLGNISASGTLEMFGLTTLGGGTIVQASSTVVGPLNVTGILNASSTLLVGGNFVPGSNNSSDIGSYETSFKDIYASGSMYLAKELIIGTHATNTGASYGFQVIDHSNLWTEVMLHSQADILAIYSNPQTTGQYGSAAITYPAQSTGLFAANSGYDLVFGTYLVSGASERMRITDGNGFIGIGTPSPTDLLTISGGVLSITNNITTSSLGFDYLTVASSTSNARGLFHVDSSGNTSVSGSLRIFNSVASAGLEVTATAGTTTLTSYATDAAASAAFEFKSNATMTSGTDRSLAVFTNNGATQVAISAGGNVYANESFIANANEYGIGDVAEYVNVASRVEAGDIIVVDHLQTNQYLKSSVPYQPTLAGVITDTGAFVIGASGPNRAPLSVAGVVNVKVSTVNGAIAIGDRITSSDLEGVGMKSTKDGLTIGVALESYSNSKAGKIKMLVNNTWWFPEVKLAELSVDGAGSSKSAEGGLVSADGADTEVVGSVGLFEKVLSWFRNIGVVFGEGVVEVIGLIGEKIIANTIKTNELCINTTCITEAEFKALLNKDVSGATILEIPLATPVQTNPEITKNTPAENVAEPLPNLTENEATKEPLTEVLGNKIEQATTSTKILPNKPPLESQPTEPSAKPPLVGSSAKPPVEQTAPPTREEEIAAGLPPENPAPSENNNPPEVITEKL